ncbi:MAG: hypothetical protein R3A46_12705 [Thermomicrobiales bacterium]
MTSDSGLFRTRDDLEAAGYRLHGNIFTLGSDRYLPLYEAKMMWHFEKHRYADDFKVPATTTSIRATRLFDRRTSLP